MSAAAAEEEEEEQEAGKWKKANGEKEVKDERAETTEAALQEINCSCCCWIDANRWRRIHFSSFGRKGRTRKNLLRSSWESSRRIDNSHHSIAEISFLVRELKQVSSGTFWEINSTTRWDCCFTIKSMKSCLLIKAVISNPVSSNTSRIAQSTSNSSLLILPFGKLKCAVDQSRTTTHFVIEEFNKIPPQEGTVVMYSWKRENKEPKSLR